MTPLASSRETHALNQDAVYWGAPVAGIAGQRAFADPVAIKCRWEERHELFRDQGTGEQTVSRAVVHVDRAVLRGGYLWLGLFDDLTSAESASPDTELDSHEIRSYEAIPDFHGTEFTRVAWL